MQVLRFFRQTIQKSAGRVPPLSRIFVKYDGKDASRCVLKASAVNCAVLPEERTMKLSNLKVLSIQNLRGIDTNGEDLR